MPGCREKFGYLEKRPGASLVLRAHPRVSVAANFVARKTRPWVKISFTNKSASLEGKKFKEMNKQRILFVQHREAERKAR